MHGAETVEQYLANLPADRLALSAVREIILRNLPAGYEEGIQFGMISYHVPLVICPNTYNGKPLCYVALAAQKNYMSLYLMGVYGNQETADCFHQEYARSGKKLDMGKSCVRFRKLVDLPLDLIARTVARWPIADFIRCYERSRNQRRGG